MLLVKSIALIGWFIKPPRSGVIYASTVQFKKYVSSGCFGNSNADFHFFIFFQKATKDWVTKKIMRQTYIFYIG